MEGRGDPSRLLTGGLFTEALIKNPKEREVKLRKARVLNAATPWRRLTEEDSPALLCTFGAAEPPGSPFNLHAAL